MRFRIDPRAKLYLLLLANLMLFFHVGTGAEAVATGLFLLLFFLSGHTRTGIRLSVVYFGLLAIDLFVVPLAGEGILLNLLSLVSVGIRMMLPCIITGAYAFSTTTVGELTSALRRMHVPESVIIPCAVVVRFFPTVQEDYHQIHNAMALRCIAEGKGALLLHPLQSLEYILIPQQRQRTQCRVDEIPHSQVQLGHAGMGARQADAFSQCRYREVLRDIVAVHQQRHEDVFQ